MKTKRLLLKISFFLLVNIASFTTFAQQGNYYKFLVGNTTVIALSDGTVPLSAEKLFQANDTMKVHRLLDAAYVNDPTETSINAFLIVSGKHLVLIDAGSGELFGPKHGGSLVNSLQLAGYKPEQITDILLTHIHNDHSGGLSIEGKPVFTNAIIHVNKQDTDYWLDEQRMQQADPNALSSNKSSFINAIKVFKPYLAANKVKPFTGQLTIDSITAVPTPGHTPGHTIYVLASNGEKIIFCGDLVHVSGIQFADPSLIDGFDVDKNQAIKQRIEIYSQAAKEGCLLAADHISYPGVGRLRAKSKGFEWMPIPYSLEGRTK